MPEDCRISFLSPNKIFPGLAVQPLPLVFLLVIAVGATIGLVNGFSVAKFKLHPFIVTLSTQLIVYGTILLYLKMGDNNGQTLSGLSEGYRNLCRRWCHRRYRPRGPGR